MIYSVCINCGSPKGAPYKRCRACGFDPSQDEQALAKSVYLSVGRYDEEEEHKRYRVKLEEFSHSIRAGEEVNYEPDEIERLLRQKQLVESVRTRDVIQCLVKFFLPAIVLLAGLVLLGYLPRILRCLVSLFK